MKKLILSSIFILITTLSFGQEASVENHVFGLQLGLTSGVSVHYEQKLANMLSVRTQLYTNAGYSQSLGWNVNPALALEPRLYYNLKKRETEERRTDGNTGNYFGIRSTYLQNSSYEDNRTHEVMIAPMWGIRRMIGKHFNYEFGIGPAYKFCVEREDEVGLYLDFRFGYSF